MTTSIPVHREVAPNSLSSMVKCIYCGQAKQSELQMTIRTGNRQKLRLRVPYCTQHSKQAKRNKVLVRVTWGVAVIPAAAIYALLIYLLWPYLSTRTEDDILGDIIGLLLLAAGFSAWVGAAWLIRRVLSRYITSLKDTPHDYLGFDATLRNNMLVLTFVNDRIAAEFRSSIPTQFYPPSPQLGEVASTVPEQPRATHWREGQFRIFVIVIFSSLLCVLVLIFLVYFCILPGAQR